MVPPLAIPAFALTIWLACYLFGRDPGRRVLRRTALTLIAYAVAAAAWAVAPDSTAALVLLCVPALLWAGVLIAMLPGELPERAQIDRGWYVLATVFLLVVIALPEAGRLVSLAPLLGGLVLLWRFRDQVRPGSLPVSVTVAAVLYAAGLAAVLLPVNLGASALLLAAMGVDVMLLGFVVASADAFEAGERLLPDLRRSGVAALAGALVVGGVATLTMLAVPDRPLVHVLQFVLVGFVMAYAGMPGPVRRGLDRIAFLHDDRLRLDRQALFLLAEAMPRRRERHTLIALRQDQFRRLTKRALDDYGDLGRLLRSPLIYLPTVDRRLVGRNAEKPLARALELRAVLREGVARLKPDGLFGTGEDWRHYNALYYCCVLGLRPYDRNPSTDGLDRDARRALEWFRRYVPRRSLHEWQEEGADMVADRLWHQLMRSDPRWLTRAGTLAAPPTRST